MARSYRSGGQKEIYDGLYGTTFRAKHWRSLHAAGLMCAPFSVLVHIYSLVCLGVIFVPNSIESTLVYFLAYIPCAFLALWSHYMTWTTDPGAVPKGAKPLDYELYESPKPNGMDLEAGVPTNAQNTSSKASTKLDKATPTLSDETVEKLENAIIGGGAPMQKHETLLSTKRKQDYIICASCKNYKPPRAHHDSVTGRCIVKLDHFCPWVGNAIGALNHKYFALFIFYTFLTCVTSAVIVFMAVLPCRRGQDAWKCYKLGRLPARLLYVSNAFFFLFTMLMLIDQIYIIFWQGKTKIARKKILAGKAKEQDFEDVANDFNEMFGGNSSGIALHWLIPLPLEFPQGMKEKVLGYKWEPSFHCFQKDREREADSVSVSGEPDSCPYTKLEKEEGVMP